MDRAAKTRGRAELRGFGLLNLDSIPVVLHHGRFLGGIGQHFSRRVNERNPGIGFAGKQAHLFLQFRRPRAVHELANEQGFYFQAMLDLLKEMCFHAGEQQPAQETKSNAQKYAVGAKKAPDDTAIATWSLFYEPG